MNNDCPARREQFSPGHQREADALLPYPEASLSFLTHSGHFPSGGFHWSNGDQSLSGEVLWVSARSSHCRTSPPSGEDCPLEGLLVVPGLPSISPVPHYSQISMVHPLTLCLGNGMFPFHFCRELHVEIQSRWDPHHPA